MPLLVPTAEHGSGDFHAPSIAEFFPDVIFFEGTVFQIDRIMLIRFLATFVLVLLFWLGTRKMRMIPGRGQSIVEMAITFVRVNIAEEMLGKVDGKRFLPLLVTFFFMILAFNITGIIPFLNIAGTSVIGAPLVLAIVAYVAFLYAGFKKHPGAFLKNSLFPPGVPKPIYLIVTPIEIFSIFILRPVTLALRLLMNMIAGHILLVLCFAATDWFLFSPQAEGILRLFGAGTFAFGFIFTLFEILVAFLQAYVFTLLSTVYIQLSLAEEH